MPRERVDVYSRLSRDPHVSNAAARRQAWADSPAPPAPPVRLYTWADAPDLPKWAQNHRLQRANSIKPVGVWKLSTGAKARTPDQLTDFPTTTTMTRPPKDRYYFFVGSRVHMR